MPNARYLVVEGPIGVGKTSLAELLAERLQARRLMEGPEDNPFLGQFYKDMRRYAFQTQLYFLLNRFRQQQELVQFDLFKQSLVSDYLFAKDKIFAYLTLDDNELALYERLHPLLEMRVQKPDLVIYLQASTDVLMRRIQSRARDYEQNLDRTYLEDVNAAYNHFFFHYSTTPLLVVNTTDIDFVKHKEDFEDLVKQVEAVQAGTHYYVPLGSRR
ncbi:MAG: deoxynucleoside kinase [Candidatus Methylomirabilaceae bacterium]